MEKWQYISNMIRVAIRSYNSGLSPYSTPLSRKDLWIMSRFAQNIRNTVYRTAFIHDKQNISGWKNCINRLQNKPSWKLDLITRNDESTGWKYSEEPFPFSQTISNAPPPLSLPLLHPIVPFPSPFPFLYPYSSSYTPPFGAVCPDKTIANHGSPMHDGHRLHRTCLIFMVCYVYFIQWMLLKCLFHVNVKDIKSIFTHIDEMVEFWK